MKFPRIYLVLDNCFAIKRWVKPAEWMSLIKEIGFNYAQASTDNEIDPLFNPANYMDDWFAEVQRCADATGVKVVNFYTGYQTYRTVGLAHHDARVRQRLMQDWLKPMIRRLAAMGAVGIGFSLFAIPDEALQDPDKYQERTELILPSSVWRKQPVRVKRSAKCRPFTSDRVKPLPWIKGSGTGFLIPSIVSSRRS